MGNTSIKTLVVLLAIAVYTFADQAIIDTYEDSYIWQSMPDTCYGDDSSLSVGYDSGYASILVWFDVSSYSGVTVDTASIYTYIYNHGGAYSNVNIGRNIAYWSEDTVTWNNRPEYAGYISVPYVPSAGWWEIDVTSFVQNFVSGIDPNYGLRIGKGDSDFGFITMCSKEYSDESLRPYLDLNYHVTAVESKSLGTIKAAFK